MKFFQDSLEYIAESLELKYFILTKNAFRDDEKLRLGEAVSLKLLTKKGIYPYDFIDSFDRFNETDLPSKDRFFSKLRQECISTEEYSRAKLI